ncbi:MAG: glycosyltransferase family 4 protein [Candidatus Bathyarchaeota archaeon]|nr:glycosyltransferase family 4 protein [Candidatus Bathyarchaeota archaeon]
MLKILIFNWRCWLNPSMGGAEVFTYENAKRWVNAGHEVTLFTSQFEGCRKEEISDGIKIIRAGGKYSVYWWAKKFYKRRFAKENYDIIIDEINTKPFLTPKFVGSEEKIVALIHQLAREYWLYETPFPISYIGYHYLEEKWLKNYVETPTVTVSKSSKLDLEKLGFKQVFIVSEGLNVEPLKEICKKERHPVVAYVGRLKRAKRPDHAIKAFRLVKERFPSAELWIIGDGYFRKVLKRMSFDGVRFFPKVGNVERRRLLKKTWVLVNPSVREGFGLNVVEANAFGVPCVAYDVNGLRDSVKDGETGLLVESGSVKSLADGLINVLEDENLRLRLSRNALEYARGFSWDKSTEEFLNILRRI